MSGRTELVRHRRRVLAPLRDHREPPSLAAKKDTFDVRTTRAGSRNICVLTLRLFIFSASERTRVLSLEKIFIRC